MRVLEDWVATPAAAAAGWTVLHSLWEGLVIAATLAAALAALRSARARYAAACAAMLAMVGGFGLTLYKLMPEGARGVRGMDASVFPPWHTASGAGTLESSLPGLAAAVPWLAPFWMLGVCVFYLGHAANWISACRLRRRGVCSAPESWQACVARLSARLHLSRPVRLLESCLVDAPLILGHFRPLILMPLGLLSGLPAGQIEAILLHELAHVRRYDYLVNVLQRFVEGLLFYHPATWWVSRVIRAERENCCDDVVVANGCTEREYAFALAALEEHRQCAPEPAVAATGGSLVKRIRRLLRPKHPNAGWTPLVAAAVLTVTAVVAFAAWQSKPPQPQAKSGAESPYVKWLNEDVAYIVTKEERAAFEKLATDAEREKFIEQFWLRRDPTPGTPANEFKEEHYRRIAYANRRFAAGVPGWRTDRGRIYIIYGPPDQIESHPQGPQRPEATEIWLYRHVADVGDNVSMTFVDREGKGEFRLTPRSAR